MPKFSDLKRYCEKTGWTLLRMGNHYYYEKVLSSGEILKTKVSHSLSKEIPPRTFKDILKKQLKTTLEEFNANS
jgi:hypothetical protein